MNNPNLAWFLGCVACLVFGAVYGSQVEQNTSDTSERCWCALICCDLICCALGWALLYATGSYLMLDF